jgi:hypothetical protein
MGATASVEAFRQSRPAGDERFFLIASAVMVVLIIARTKGVRFISALAGALVAAPRPRAA